jgi:putative mRNA 3-end processing factor
VSLLQFTDRGIFCPKAGVYLDPWKPVDKALITHGHSDHARWGSNHYLCTEKARPVIQHRLNVSNIQTVKYGQVVPINGVNFSFHPAGHIVGSAQIRVECNDEIWVFSGDYKLQNDGVSEPFEVVKCNTFITESTFGLPIYRWKKQTEIFEQINSWWRKNKEEGKVSVLSGYALGKAQRLLMNIDTSIGKIFLHGAIESINQIFKDQQLALPQTHLITKDTTKKDWAGALVLCPPSAVASPWMKKFYPYSLAVASGWMALRGTRRRRGADRGFALSDHADWDELNTAVRETGAEKIFVTHGYAEIFAKWLREKGLDAHEVKTEYEGELEEENKPKKETDNKTASEDE